MFTGIIEEIGFIKSFTPTNFGADIVIKCSKILGDMKIGDSISVNGVCQTVVEFSSDWFRVNVSEQTLNVTNFRSLKIDDVVNLERAITLNTRLGGHIVSGHVDGLAKFLRCEKLGNYNNLEFSLPENLVKYVVNKGSVTINGISLTVAEIVNNVIKIAIIPHSFNNTNLKTLIIGQFVNIETDVLAKYVEKMLLLNQTDKGEKNISLDFLKENGYL